MIKKFIKYFVILVLLAGVIGLLVCKTVNLYIEKTYGDVKTDA